MRKLTLKGEKPYRRIQQGIKCHCSNRPMFNSSKILHWVLKGENDDTKGTQKISISMKGDK